MASKNREQIFEELYDRLQTGADSDKNEDEQFQIMEKVLPNLDDLEDYLDFHNERTVKQPTLMPFADFRTFISNACYDDESDLHGVIFEVSKYGKLMFPLGRDRNGNMYCLSQGCDLLVPTNDAGDFPNTMPESLLAVNYNCKASDQDPGERGKLGDSETSPLVKSNDSADAGFVFFQLGRLAINLGRQEWQQVRQELLTSDYSRVDDWRDTDFAVVVEIRPTFRAGAVYVIYNCWQEDEITGYRNHDHIGERDRNFSIAKIAESIDELHVDYRFDFDIKCRDEVPLYLVNRLDDGTLVKRTPQSDDWGFNEYPLGGICRRRDENGQVKDSFKKCFWRCQCAACGDDYYAELSERVRLERDGWEIIEAGKG